MPFTLSNAPATFQNYIYHCLEGLLILGFVVIVEGIKIDADRVKSIQEWSRPKGYHDI